MAFKGIDFGKLSRQMEERRAMDPEDLQKLEEREEFARSAKRIYADERDRDAASSERKVVKLMYEPEVRFDMNDGFQIQFLYSTDGKEIDFEAGSPNMGRVIYQSSEAESHIANKEKHDAVNKLIEGLEVGDTFTALGEDRERSWRDRDNKLRTTTEFVAMRFAQGDVSREDMMRPTPLAQASRAYIEAETGKDKVEIASRYLGHAPFEQVRSKGPVREAEADMPLELSRGGAER